MITPIHSIKIKNNNNHFFVKREDLLPFCFGGNKVRIAQEFFNDMDAKGKNCIIGYGNARSNLCRVLANISSSRGVVCYIISPSDDNGNRVNANNCYMVKFCGAQLRYCSKQNVPDTIQAVLEECVEQGLFPYYIYGNKFGQGNETIPMRAYVKVYKEICQQEADMHLNFDYIFLATGTGMTQAGLIAGQAECHGDKRIIGISVARERKRETEVLQSFLEAYCQENNLDTISEKEITICDDYLCGGYSKYNDKIVAMIKEVFCTTGMPLDPTYTGKAFWGMCEFIKQNKIKDKNILFLHTGGTPGFFDNISLLE